MTRRVLVLQTLGQPHLFTPNNALLTLARRLDRARYTLGVAVPREGLLTEALRRAGAEVFILGGLRTYRRHDALWRWPAVSLKAARLAWRFGAQLIVANHAELAPFARAAARLTGRPWICFLRQADRPPEYYLKYGVARAAAVAAVSEGAIRGLRVAMPAGTILPPTRVIPTGIELPEDGVSSDRLLRSVLGAAPSDRIVGAVGLRGVKRPDRLVEALGRILPTFPGVRGLLVGDLDPVHQRSLEALVAQRGLAGRLHFAGRQASMAPWFAAMDVFAHPSEREGLPKAVLEAMAHRLPVVAFRVGGIPEAIEDGVTGFLCPPGDIEAFASRLLRLVTQAEEAVKMGESGRMRILERFSAATMVQGMMDLFDSTIEGRRLRGA